MPLNQKPLTASFYFCMIALFCAIQNANAQDANKIKRPFLWKVEPIQTESGSTSHAYLFGTIHIPDEWINTMHPTALAAWEESRAAYFEVDFLKDSAKQTQAISRTDGKKLEELIPAELVQRLDARLKKVSPLGRNLLPKVHVIAWPLLTESLQAQKGGGLPMDLKLYTDGMARNYKLGGLEDPTTQLKPLIDLPIERQTEYLKLSLDMWDEDDAKGVDRLQEMKLKYAEGNAESFNKYFKKSLADSTMDEEFKNLFLKTMLTDRNERMAAKIVELMKQDADRIHFFAVGTGHLIGENTVQSFLKKLNVQSKRVPEKTPEPVENATPTEIADPEK